jgi:hypothetical protein
LSIGRASGVRRIRRSGEQLANLFFHLLDFFFGFAQMIGGDCCALDVPVLRAVQNFFQFQAALVKMLVGLVQSLTQLLEILGSRLIHRVRLAWGYFADNNKRKTTVARWSTHETKATGQNGFGRCIHL